MMSSGATLSSGHFERSVPCPKGYCFVWATMLQCHDRKRRIPCMWAMQDSKGAVEPRQMLPVVLLAETPAEGTAAYRQERG